MAEQAEFSDRVEIFSGATSSAVCRLYARYDQANEQGEWQLQGTLTGPRCAYAETLPATFTFVDRGAGPTLLAEAVVSEPNFWTPQMPHLYTARLELRRGGRAIAAVERSAGIRPLGAAGRKLVLDGKSWVLRAVRRDELAATDLAAWHDAETAIYVREPDDELCAQASRLGVLLVAELTTGDVAVLRRLARWPAVGMVALPPTARFASGAVARNLILAERVDAGEPLDASRPDWAEATIVGVGAGGELPPGFGEHSLPIVGDRATGPVETVAQGRQACDQLQREVAPRGQLAGYIV